MYKNSLLLKIMSLFVSALLLMTMFVPIISNAGATDTAKKVVLKTVQDIKNNIDDTSLRDWLDSKFEQHGNKSNYIKYVLRKEMKKEIEANK